MVYEVHQRAIALVIRSRGKVLRASYPFAAISLGTVTVPMPLLELEFLSKNIIKPYFASMHYSQEPQFEPFLFYLNHPAARKELYTLA